MMLLRRLSSIKNKEQSYKGSKYCRYYKSYNRYVDYGELIKRGRKAIEENGKFERTIPSWHAPLYCTLKLRF